MAKTMKCHIFNCDPSAGSSKRTLLICTFPPCTFRSQKYDSVPSFAEYLTLKEQAPLVRQRDVAGLTALAGLDPDCTAVRVEVFDDQAGDLSVATACLQRGNDQIPEVLVACGDKASALLIRQITNSGGVRPP